jgi:dynein heavy chain
VIAIDTIDFDFAIISDETKYDLSKGAEDGVYVDGLFVEGCRWDDKKEALDESMPKVLYTQMKTIWVVPKQKANID